MSTVWTRRENIFFLKAVATVRGDETLDATVTHVLDHYRSCARGLDVDVIGGKKRLEALKQFRLVSAE